MYTFVSQVQYVRLVSTPASGTTNVVTVGKTKSQTTLQTVSVGQKIGGQQQIVKVCNVKVKRSYMKESMLDVQ